MPHFSSEITFLADVTDRNALLFPIKRLLSELGEFLNGRQLCTSHLSWRLAHRSHAPTDFTVSLAEPENDSAVFLSLTQLRLETLGSVGEVDSLSLAVRSFVPANSKAGDLFHGTRYRNRDGRISSPADKAHTDALLNMLGARLGQDSCFGLAIVSDHRPEKAWARLSTSEIDSRRNNGPIEPNARPAFLLSTPKTLTTTDGIPCLGGKLSLMEGPERIDFGWWDRHDIDQPAARDYYVAREPTGALVWIFRYPADSASARWYLHGIFS
ncbi:MAG: hypothetical protein U5O39_16810 [Gammaproteobacteria bacterium]|nr:hypothetical protein [Gammaproteobacteria bacterium]